MLTHRYRQTGRPNGHDKRRDGHSGGEKHGPDEECGPESGDPPEPAGAGEREQDSDTCKHQGLDGEGRMGDEGSPEGGDDR